MKEREKLNILLVDDKPENLVSLEALLENPDHNIIKTTSGNKALSLMLEYDFALVLLDVQMPEMDGFEMAELMRGSEKTKYIPIIFVTAISKEQKHVFKGYESGAVDYLFKPLDPDILKSKVNVFIELHRQKKLLAQSMEFTDNIIKSMVDALIVVSPDRTIGRINHTTLNLLGYSEEELMGKPIEMLFGGETDCNDKMFEALVAKVIVKDYDMTLQTKNGETIPVSLSCSMMLDCEHRLAPLSCPDYRQKKGHCEDKVTGVVIIVRDMRESRLVKELERANRELKDATAQLIQSEKLSALGELTAGVAHELKQPLNGIKIISQSLLKDIERGQFEEEELGEDLQDVVNQVNKMAEIIDHMRIFTRSSEGTVHETIDVNSIVEGAFKFLGQQLKNHNIEVGEDLGSDLPKVDGDPNRLEQVFLNLISNARNAIKGGGKEKMRINIRTYTDNTNGGSSVVIEVKDNGSGVPEHIREKIFQPFFTTNAPGNGTGLGLSVSSKIIEEHRGRIELDSTVGEGTTFRMILPGVD
jgi:PAS domain S-box-containing protein